MIITDAIWEKRNLGVTCQEITIDRADNINCIASLRNLQSQYQVLRLPIDKPEFILPLQSAGFNFIEIIYQSLHDLSTPTLDKVTNRMMNEFSFRIASHSNTQKIKDNILQGIFKTDRVALDKNFCEKASGERYSGWLTDELKSGGYLFEFCRGETVMGFFLMSIKSDICDAKIGGVYKNANGLGTILGYQEILAARWLKCRSLTANFSSNNSSVYQMNSLLGYKIRPLFNVFIKHK